MFTITFGNADYINNLNKNFRIISQTKYDENGDSLWVEKFNYDTQGKIIEIRQEETNPNFFSKFNLFTRKYLFSEYYDTDFLLETDEKTTSIYSYNELGKVTEMLLLNFFNRVIKKETYVYDSMGNHIEQVNFFPVLGLNKWRKSDAERTSKSIFKFDHQNTCISKEYFRDGELKAKHIPSYDSNGNVITGYSYDSKDELESTFQFQYNHNGAIEAKFHYDKKGILKESTIYKYQYDEKGNWIKGMYFNDDKLTGTICRDLQY